MYKYSNQKHSRTIVKIHQLTIDKNPFAVRVTLVLFEYDFSKQRSRVRDAI